MMQRFYTPWMEISISVSFYWTTYLLWYSCANFCFNPWATLSQENDQRKTFRLRRFHWTASMFIISILIRITCKWPKFFKTLRGPTIKSFYPSGKYHFYSNSLFICRNHRQFCFGIIDSKCSTLKKRVNFMNLCYYQNSKWINTCHHFLIILLFLKIQYWVEKNLTSSFPQLSQ